MRYPWTYHMQYACCRFWPWFPRVRELTAFASIALRRLATTLMQGPMQCWPDFLCEEWLWKPSKYVLNHQETVAESNDTLSTWTWCSEELPGLKHEICFHISAWHGCCMFRIPWQTYWYYPKDDHQNGRHKCVLRAQTFEEVNVHNVVWPIVISCQ